jgi:uncharacterized protein YdhG (YjbR/CyaY superfamily)
MADGRRLASPALSSWSISETIVLRSMPSAEPSSCWMAPARAIISSPRHQVRCDRDEEVSMSPQKDAQKSAKRTGAKASKGFTAEERAAMRERAKELKAAQSKAEAESDVLAKIAEMPKADRDMAERLHALIKDSAPELSPRTWYGMPAYAKDGKVVCFFQSAEKFKSRYATIGFSDKANLDEGAMWPTSYALKQLTAADAARIGELVKKAVS